MSTSVCRGCGETVTAAPETTAKALAAHARRCGFHRIGACKHTGACWADQENGGAR